MSRQKSRAAPKASPSSRPVESKNVGSKRRDKDPSDGPLSKKLHGSEPAKAAKRAHDEKEDLPDTLPSAPKRVAAAHKVKSKSVSPSPAPAPAPAPAVHKVAPTSIAAKPAPESAARKSKAQASAAADNEVKRRATRVEAGGRHRARSTSHSSAASSSADLGSNPKTAAPAAPSSAPPTPTRSVRGRSRTVVPNTNAKTGPKSEPPAASLAPKSRPSSVPRSGKAEAVENDEEAKEVTRPFTRSQRGVMPAPEFWPSWDEMQDLPTYLETLTRLSSSTGMALIHPPPEFHRAFAAARYKLSDEALAKMTDAEVWDKVYNCPASELNMNKRVRPLVQTAERCKVDGQGDFGLLDNELLRPSIVTVTQFLEIYETKTEQKVDLSTTKPGDTTGLDKFEKDFWKGLFDTKEFRLYAPNTPGSLFPPLRDFNVWNLRNLDSALKLAGSKQIAGVNTSFTFYGLQKTVFAWHSEDLELYSANYHLWGKPKKWFTIAPEHYDLFRNMTPKAFPEEHKLCAAPIRHKQFLYSPHKLAKKGFAVYQATQYAGDFIITFPKGLHCGFNFGFNIAEAANAATPSWFPIGKTSDYCTCGEGVVRLDVDKMSTKHDAIEKEAARKAQAAT